LQGADGGRGGVERRAAVAIHGQPAECDFEVFLAPFGSKWGVLWQM